METENISTNIYLSKSVSLRGGEADAAIHMPVIVSVASVSETAQATRPSLREGEADAAIHAPVIVSVASVSGTAQATRPSLRGGEADEAIQNRPISQENAVTGLPRACGARNDSVSHRKPRRRIAATIGNILFYLTLVAILIAGLAYGSQNGRSIFGYSVFTALSGSMEREIPEGSLIIVKRVEPETIQVGDDITFFKNANTTVTHRVVNIYEDYEGSGVRGFETKGIENPMADEDIVYADNVIGRVIYHTAAVGEFFNYIKEHIVMVAALLIGILILCIALKVLFSEGKRPSLRGGEADETA